MDYVYELLIKEKKDLEAKLQEVCKALQKYDKPKKVNMFEFKFTPNKDKVEEEEVSYESQEDAKEFMQDRKKEVSALSNNQKLLYALKENQRFMKIREISEYLIEITGGDVDELVTQLSRRTGKLKKLNKIVKFQHGTDKRNTFWGSPNWLNENGEIKEGFMYNKDLVRSKQGESLFDI